MKHGTRTIGTIKLAELLAEKFADCVIGFNNGTWKPKWEEERATVNFLHFQNGKKIGTQRFMRSVAIDKKIFLQGACAEGFYRNRYESEYNKLNKNGDMKVLQLTGFTNAMRATAERLLKNKNVIKLIPDSITIISASKFGKRPFTGGQESSDWGDETPPNQTPLNTTDSSKTQNPLNIPRTNEEKRYAYYKTLARPEQSNFRKMLLEGYNTACVITGCTTKAALEAAHIIPFSQDGEDTLENGLLLRADLHLLFDKGFMFVNPKTSEVHFKETDKNYDKYTHAKIPDNDKLRENLKIHWQKFQTT